MTNPTSKQFLVLNQSRITDFMRCPKLFRMRYIHGLDQGTKALHIGSMTHKLLEGYNKAKELGQEFKPEQPEEVTDDIWEVAEKLFWAYYREYQHDTVSIIQPEVKASTHFGTVRTQANLWEVWLISTLDGIIQQDGGLYLEEYKTCANLGAAQFARFMNDYQITTYMWVAKKALGLTLDGARITLLPKTKDPQPTRIRVVRTSHQFQEWERTTLHIVQNMIKCFESSYFPQYPTACTNWNRACMFHEFCMTNDDSTLADLERRDDDYTEEKKAELELLEGAPHAAQNE